jgi:SAM-dependent MidA family methyltransferase
MIPLQQVIVERIQREGPIPFAEYMRMALYEPEFGYYVSGPMKMGWEGDYYTSTDVSNLFAHCMGRQLSQLWQRLGLPGRFIVLEQGAGRGDLQRGVLAWASKNSPELHAALEYHTEDIHSGHDVGAPFMAPARFIASREGGEIASREDGGIAQPTIFPSVIISNELVDAFPVHIVEKRDSRLYEVYVTVEDGQLREVLDEPSSSEVAEYLDRFAVPWTQFQDGWRAEINLDARRWMERCVQLLTAPFPEGFRLHYPSGPSIQRKRRGYLLTIDYGEKARELYTPQRYRGTLASYFQHQMTERPLVRPGKQDITAHVNFSALIAEGRRLGLRLDRYTTQRHWLTTMGIYEELQQVRAREYALLDTPATRGSDSGQIALLQWYTLRHRVEALTDMSGMGNFKVLLLKRT